MATEETSAELAQRRAEQTESIQLASKWQDGDGSPLPVYVTPTGHFWIWPKGRDTYMGEETLEKLSAKWHRQAKAARKKIAVEFARVLEDRFAGPMVKNGTITGQHAGNQNFLIEWEDGRKEQSNSRYDYEKAMRKLTPEEKGELRGLLAARDDARRAVGEYMGHRRFNARAAAEAALKDD